MMTRCSKQPGKYVETIGTLKENKNNLQSLIIYE